MAEQSEVKNKRNTDYSASAVNLTNTTKLAMAMNIYRNEQADLQKLQEEADSYIPDTLRESIAKKQDIIAHTAQDIRGLIDLHGSYQDVEHGIYAVKQRKLSKSYKAEPFEKTYPQYAPAVIAKAVDVAKLTGLIKGGLLDEARLEADGVLTISETYSYIIK
jgi:Holliday junction resolvase-like predicted endonuclease